MSELRADIDALRESLRVGVDLVPVAMRNEISGVLGQTESRLGHLGPTVVVALAGGTGSGKSSLLNALAGQRLVEAGVLRPTTQRATAMIPEQAENGLLLLLADLGIRNVEFQDRDPHLALIDLPDIDSVELEHRAMVDRLVPRVDAVVWVLDPTKYNDALVHDHYLKPLRAYEGQFLIVINQMDRLTPTEQQDVLRDLRATLARDGFNDLPVLGVAADPATGQPFGLGDLRAEIDQRFRAKQAAQGRLRVTIDGLTAQLRTIAGSPSDLPDRDEVFSDAADQIARGIIDNPEIGRAGDIGASDAHRAAWGPLGLITTGLRGSVVGRMLGLRPDELLDERLLASASRATARLGPAVLLQDWTTDVALVLGEPLGRQVRVTVGDLDDVVRRATTEARGHLDGSLRVARPVWWTIVGLVRTLAVVALVVVGGALWSDPTMLAPGRVPVPLGVAVLAVLAIVLLGRLVRSSGRSAGEATARAHRATLAVAARESLDFHVGRPIDDVLAVRQALREALPAADAGSGS